MSKKFTFTHASLRKFFEANGKAICWDATTRGLGAYARSDGGITLFCMWRVGSRLKKKALFHLGERSLQEARTMCAEYTISGRHGKDVLAEQRQASHQALTLLNAYEAHRQSLIRRGASERSIAFNASNWKLRLEKHGSRTLSSITKSEARNWHEGWLRAGAGPTGSNNTARLLRTVISYAIRKLDVDITNAAIGIEFFKQRNRREAVDDLPAFWAALDTVGNPLIAGFYRIAILTGLRRNDILSMRWSDVHEDRIFIPFPKMRRPFDCPMTDALRNVLQSLKEHGRMLFPGSPYVCPAASSERASGEAVSTAVERLQPAPLPSRLCQCGGSGPSQSLSRKSLARASGGECDGGLRHCGFRAKGRGGGVGGVMADGEDDACAGGIVDGSACRCSLKPRSLPHLSSGRLVGA